MISPCPLGTLADTACALHKSAFDPKRTVRVTHVALMQFAHFGLLTAILALESPYLTLDLWVQRSPHEIGLSTAVWAGDRLNASLLTRKGFFPRFNEFCHPELTRKL